mmetsp:Transcript_98082/g.277396  ORF Transcript_98082/g.277396 Transcript_98082/m.277396 type:complete len:143 (-) Transcript_98082:311-739(-)
MPKLHVEWLASNLEAKTTSGTPPRTHPVAACYASGGAEGAGKAHIGIHGAPAASRAGGVGCAHPSENISTTQAKTTSLRTAASGRALNCGLLARLNIPPHSSFATAPTVPPHVLALNHDCLPLEQRSTLLATALDRRWSSLN